MKIHFKFLLLLSFISLNTQCIIDALYLDRHGDQLICRIGEFHQPIYDPTTRSGATEFRDTQQIMNLVHAVGQTEKPTTLILEVVADLPDDIDQSMVPLSIFNAMARLAVTKKGLIEKYPNLHIVCAETRLELMHELNSLGQLTGTKCFREVFMTLWNTFEDKKTKSQLESFLDLQYSSWQDHLISLETFITENPHIKSIYDKAIDKFAYTTLKPSCASPLSAIFGEIDRNIQRLTTILQKQSATDCCRPFVEKIIQQTTESFNALKNFFSLLKNYDPCKPSYVVLANIIKEKGFLRIRELVEITNKLLFFVDADFALEIQRALHKQEHVIIVTGSKHSTRLDPFLASLNCTPIIEPRINICHLKTIESHMTDQELDGIFRTIKATFERTQQQKSATHTCANCGATENLKHCARCKQVWYCSRDCQAKDWQTHKQQCKSQDEKFEQHTP